MSKKSYNRILCDKQHVSYFLRNAFSINEFLSHTEFEKICSNIATIELQIIKTANEGTLFSKSHRHPSVTSESDRKKLRRSILDDLISKERLANDDDIKMGKAEPCPLLTLRRNLRLL